jgi:hypothetical protein
MPMTQMTAGATRRGLPLELAAVWALLLAVVAAVLVTYARLEPAELYHVSNSGLGGGMSRAVVLLNFPLALVAIAVLLLLLGQVERRLRTVALVGMALCAVVFVPGVVDPDDLDARPANAAAAAGVGVAVALSLAVWRRGGFEPAIRGVRERLRLAIAAVAFLLAIPWLLADLGFFADGIPLLGSVFETGALRTQPGDPVPHSAVHRGHHHGLDGTLLVWCGLLVVPLLATLRGAARIRSFTTAYVALMLCYGAANLVNDFWLEQIVKRGWTDREFPSALEPGLTVAWAGVLVATVAVWALLVRSARTTVSARR